MSGWHLHLGPLGPLPLLLYSCYLRRRPADLLLREELCQKLLELQEPEMTSQSSPEHLKAHVTTFTVAPKDVPFCSGRRLAAASICR
jgi:hypothetical protein